MVVLRSVLAAAAVGATLLVPGTAAAQEDVPSDSAAAADAAVGRDTLVGELPGDLVGVLADSADEGRFVVLAPPRLLEPVGGDIVTWNRERIRRSNATSLSELVVEMTPGVTLLRTDFFGGPHHILDGIFGPGALEVRVDGRPLVPMIGSQIDMSQIPLAAIDQVSVRRGAASLEVDLTTLRRTEPQAYSRVEAGTGEPGLEGLRLAFVNGFASDFAIATAFDLLDVGGVLPMDLQSFWGSVSWAPGDGESGLELQYEGGSFDRSTGNSDAGRRRRIVLGGRLGLTEHLQASGWIARSTRELDANLQLATSDSREQVAEGGLEVRGTWDRAWLRMAGRSADHVSLPSTRVELAAGARVLPWLSVAAAGTASTWEDFDAREGRMALGLDLPVAGLRVTGEGSAGVRGAPFVGTDGVSADSVKFQAIAGRVELPVGGYTLAGRVEHQRVDRQLSFGTGFDVAGSFQPQVHLTGLELSVDGPILPMGWLIDDLDPVRVRGFYRRNDIGTPRTPFFIPTNTIRGELYIHDSFLEDDLEVRLSVGIDRRDPWLTPPIPGGGSFDPIAVPSRTSWDFDLGIRIVRVVIFWRFDNLAGSAQQDLAAFSFPTRRSALGLRWEFLD
jgi:hypothetical protein